MVGLIPGQLHLIGYVYRRTWVNVHLQQATEYYPIISRTFDVVVPEEVKSLGVYATTFTSVAASFGSSSNATSSGINLMRTNESGYQETLTTAGCSTVLLDSAVPNSASCMTHSEKCS